MIIVRLIGGLGNQMFQYALASRIRIKRNIQVKLDVSWYFDDSKKDTKRFYGLNNFNVIEDFSSVDEVAKFLKSKSFFSRALNRLKIIIFGKKDYSDFSLSVLNAKDGSYLDGYWQNEKYFIDIRDELLESFKLKKELGHEAKKVLDEIRKHKSVSIHIRRGDYVSDKVVKKNFGICDVSYYKTAVDYIKKEVNDPLFFVFSDDIDWVKENLKLDVPMFFVSSKEIKDFEELVLMSFCNHNIIANSSFSWWGAWLNNNHNKIVVAPKRWFSKIKMRNIIPESWAKL